MTKSRDNLILKWVNNMVKAVSSGHHQQNKNNNNKTNIQTKQKTIVPISDRPVTLSQGKHPWYSMHQWWGEVHNTVTFLKGGSSVKSNLRYTLYGLPYPNGHAVNLETRVHLEVIVEKITFDTSKNLLSHSWRLNPDRRSAPVTIKHCSEKKNCFCYQSFQQTHTSGWRLKDFGFIILVQFISFGCTPCSM